MQVAAQINNYIESVPPGKIITYGDFKDLQETKPQALAKALGRLVKKQVLIRQAKGAFYRPKKTLFGSVGPADEELISFLTRKGDEITGILTGQSVYLQLQIATQVPSVLTIASVAPRRKQNIGKIQVQYVRSYVDEIQEADIPLLQLLEALRFIKKAQDCAPDDVIQVVGTKMVRLTKSDLERLVKLAKSYPPMVRALCGCLSEGMVESIQVDSLRGSLNPYTKFKVMVSDAVLKNKKAWGIM
ncbi:DUF6088 family protein [Maridesulfovibrio sp.]|uniref:DUF6088 family protein n=1 Tax=Maridesulfovibrio sp. TaxID=2795000 RepID=UPI002AA933C6|nr:DUF6088 family protein [Maridesulfovibrio sp.]